MNPRFFFDIEVKGSLFDSGISAPVIRGKALSILHSFFRRQPYTYALGIPDGGRSLRIFATSRDELDVLVSDLRSLPWMRDYMNFSYPQMVPDEFKGPWITYKRYRIPTVKSDRKSIANESKLRNRRMNFVRENRLDYFILRSKSNEQIFSLTVQKLIGEANHGDCRPNSYGFSSTSEPFSLPDIRQ
jgi:CRISPR-associated endoribonuclease Cas6/Csy4 subtype I-F